MEMKMLYKGDKTVLVQINADKVYYGDGKEINAIGKSVNQFLRFNPYLTPTNEDVPKEIKLKIKSML